MITDKILEGIKKEEEGRQRTSPVRMSSAGKCARAIAYQLHGYKAEELPPRALMVFRLGDTVESEIKALIAKYKPDNYLIEYPTDPIEVTINGVKIQGHVDGHIKLPTEAILEIKSISDMGFKLLEREGVSYEYRCQAVMYQKAMNIPRTVFIFYNKNTSKMLQITYEYEEKIWQDCVKRWTDVTNSTKTALPEREYVPNEKGKLDWHCMYCGWNKTCWPDQELKFSKAGKPEIYVNAKAA